MFPFAMNMSNKILIALTQCLCMICAFVWTALTNGLFGTTWHRLIINCQRNRRIGWLVYINKITSQSILSGGSTWKIVFPVEEILKLSLNVCSRKRGVQPTTKTVNVTIIVLIKRTSRACETLFPLPSVWTRWLDRCTNRKIRRLHIKTIITGMMRMVLRV